MSCKYERLINDMLNGKIQEYQKDELYEHAKDCNICSSELREIEFAEDFIKNSLLDYPFTSNKEQIINKVKSRKSKFHIKPVLYKCRKFNYAVAIMLILVISITVFKPIYNKFKSDSYKYSSANTIEQVDTYVKIPDINEQNINIKQLYPSYLPEGLNLDHRTVLGNFIRMYFKNKSDSKEITFSISLNQSDVWPKTEKIKNSSGEWHLIIYPPINGSGFSKICGNVWYLLNSNIYVGVDSENLTENEILQCIESLKTTQDILKNNISDREIYDYLNPKMFKLNNGNYVRVTVNEAIKIVQDLNLKYKVEGASPEEYNKSIYNIDVKNHVVILFMPEN